MVPQTASRVSYQGLARAVTQYGPGSSWRLIKITIKIKSSKVRSCTQLCRSRIPILRFPRRIPMKADPQPVSP
jgi:hypothetical protein